MGQKPLKTMTTAQKFVVGFVIAYFVFLFLFMSRYEVDKPLPVSARYVLLSLVVVGAVTVAVLSRRPPVASRRPRAIPDRTAWPFKAMIAVYVFSLIGGIWLIVTRQIPLRIAAPGLAFVAVLTVLLFWQMRQVRND